MPVCVECSDEVPTLYTEYGKGNICLHVCPKCNRFADKYTEMDYVLIFIDMLLHKPQVYRHLLFNELGASAGPKGGPPSVSRWGRLSRLGSGPLPWGVIKLCGLLVFFEVYIKWATLDTNVSNDGLRSSREFVARYAALLAISFVEFATFQLLVRLMCIWMIGWRAVAPKMDSVIAGLILSSFGKLLHIVTIIWDYHDLQFNLLIKLIVFTSNMEALAAIFSLRYPRAILIIALATLGTASLQSYLGFSGRQMFSPIAHRN